ncbi:MAG: SPOR domain-containing protein, partial [Bdellovibrionales bacterium]|nr:SPOR domain-containing protein [Bdellovibrionales bacterium]
SRSSEHASKAKTVILSAIVCGSIVGAYFLGLRTGQERGLEIALGENSDSVVRQSLSEVLPVETIPSEPQQEQSTALGAAEETLPSSAPTATSEPETLSSRSAAEAIMLSRGAETSSVAAEKPKPIRQAASAKLADAATASPKAAAVQPKLDVSNRSSQDGLSVLSTAPAGFYVQVAAERTPDGAVLIGKKLKAARFNVVISKAAVGEKTYYRVLVGPHKTRDAAKNALSRVAAVKAAKARPFVKQVK